MSKYYSKAQMREAFQTGILTEAVDADYDEVFETFISELEPLEVELHSFQQSMQDIDAFHRRGRIK